MAQENTNNPKSIDRGVYSLAIGSAIITLFLFYIDEGYYNFNWMLNIGNWLAFSLYFSVIYSFQLLIYLFFPRRLKKVKLWTSLFLGAIAGILFVIKVVFMNVPV